MPTSNLIVNSSSLDLIAMEMTCWITPTKPLWIYELIIEAIVGLGATTGTVKPGTPDRPVVRTIYVDASDPIFQARAPFVLAVTYDDGTYRVRSVGVVQPALAPPFDPALIQGLGEEATAEFVTQVLQAAAPVLNPPQQSLAVHVGAVKAAVKTFQDKARAAASGHTQRNGHGEERPHGN